MVHTSITTAQLFREAGPSAHARHFWVVRDCRSRCESAPRRWWWALAIFAALAVVPAAGFAAEESDESPAAAAQATEDESAVETTADDEPANEAAADEQSAEAPQASEEPGQIEPTAAAEPIEAAEMPDYSASEERAPASSSSAEPLELPTIAKPAPPAIPETRADEPVLPKPARKPASKQPKADQSPADNGSKPVVETKEAGEPSVVKSPPKRRTGPKSAALGKPTAKTESSEERTESAEAKAIANEPNEGAAGEPTADDDLAATPNKEHQPLAPAPQQYRIEAAGFKGIQPGKSTADDLAEAWGPPKEIRKTSGGSKSLVYSIESYPKVTANTADGVVTSILVNLDKSYEPEDLAKELELENISSVQITDDQGRLLGEAFPERGVLFSYAPGDRARVSQVVLEPIDVQSFLFRGESYLRTHYSKALADANAALEIEPKLAAAYILRAKVYFQAGDLDLALRDAQAAAAIAPRPEAKLLAAKILLETCDFARARGEIRSVLDDKRIDPLSRARATALLGDCVSLAPASEEDAMQYHMQAIKQAEPLASDKSVTVRRAAKEILIDAHLGVARDVADGRWQQKAQAIGKWVARATALAEDLSRIEQGGEELTWRVERRALEAFAALADPGPGADRIDRALKHAHELIESSQDPARTARLKWQLGEVLAHACEIEHARKRPERALRYGRLAAKALADGDAAGRQLPTHDYLLGRLYYSLGVVEAVDRQDHEHARKWYAQAVKLLEQPVPPARMSDPGRQGETFVSMAVSYWESTGRDEALRLTKQGLKLMEQAVEEGHMSKMALAVPYGNLASMHAELGNKRLAAEFAEMAAKCETAKR